MTSSSDHSYPEIPDNCERVRNKYSQAFLRTRFGLGDARRSHWGKLPLKSPLKSPPKLGWSC